jgi:hypothetical protein
MATPCQTKGRRSDFRNRAGDPLYGQYLGLPGLITLLQAQPRKMWVMDKPLKLPAAPPTPERVDTKRRGAGKQRIGGVIRKTVASAATLP